MQCEISYNPSGLCLEFSKHPNSAVALLFIDVKRQPISGTCNCRFCRAIFLKEQCKNVLLHGNCYNCTKFAGLSVHPTMCQTVKSKALDSMMPQASDATKLAAFTPSQKLSCIVHEALHVRNLGQKKGLTRSWPFVCCCTSRKPLSANDFALQLHSVYQRVVVVRVRVT